MCPERNVEKGCIKINLEFDLNKIVNKLCATKSVMLYFQLKEEDLDPKTGVKIMSFLDQLKQKNVNFKISRPLPRCLFGLKYNELIKKFNIPKNCFECEELFTIEKDVIKSCGIINKEGPKIYYMPERGQIWEYFKTLKMEKEPCKRCKSCLYFKRKQCECFIPEE